MRVKVGREWSKNEPRVGTTFDMPLGRPPWGKDWVHRPPRGDGEKDHTLQLEDRDESELTGVR